MRYATKLTIEGRYDRTRGGLRSKLAALTRNKLARRQGQGRSLLGRFKTKSGQGARRAEKRFTRLRQRARKLAHRA